tara:strand:- start:170 stop:403 length:234 start_codon:yes stop_codon:yes gene_type:complete
MEQMAVLVVPVFMDLKVRAGQLNILLIKAILLAVKPEAELLRQVEQMVLVMVVTDIQKGQVPYMIGHLPMEQPHYLR